MTPMNVNIISADIKLAGRILQQINEVEGFYCTNIFKNIKEYSAFNQQAAIIILDFSVFESDWKKQIALFVQKYKGSSIVLYAEAFSSEFIIETMRLGVVGFVDKNQIESSIASVLTSVNEDGGYFSQSITKKILNYFYRPNSSTMILTPREIEVSTFLKEGLSYKQIAQRCEISIDTVRMHIRNMYRKLNIKSKIQLVNNMFEQGVTESHTVA